MKRYLVFQIEQYYPSGGMDDLKEDFDTLEQAMELKNKLDLELGEGAYCAVYVYDLQEKSI